MVWKKSGKLHSCRESSHPAALLSRGEVTHSAYPPVAVMPHRICMSSMVELSDPKLPSCRATKSSAVIEEIGAKRRSSEKRVIVGRRSMAWLDLRRVRLLPRAVRRISVPTRASRATRIDGGFAEETIADARYVFPLPGVYTDEEAAPLMCAEADRLGVRSRPAGDASETWAGYGFGAARASLRSRAGAPSRSGRLWIRASRRRKGEGVCARDGGGGGAGDLERRAPRAARRGGHFFAPVGELVPAGVAGGAPRRPRRLRPASNMSDIPSFPYEILWRERSVSSVAKSHAHRCQGISRGWRTRWKFRTETHPLSARRRESRPFRSSHGHAERCGRGSFDSRRRETAGWVSARNHAHQFERIAVGVAEGAKFFSSWRVDALDHPRQDPEEFDTLFLERRCKPIDIGRVEIQKPNRPANVRGFLCRSEDACPEDRRTSFRRLRRAAAAREHRGSTACCAPCRAS